MAEDRAEGAELIRPAISSAHHGLLCELVSDAEPGREVPPVHLLVAVHGNLADAKHPDLARGQVQLRAVAGRVYGLGEHHFPAQTVIDLELRRDPERILSVPEETLLALLCVRGCADVA